MCNLVLRKSVTSHFSKGEGMCNVYLGDILGLYRCAFLMWISISNIIFYITCFKGCITSKGDLAMEYLGYNEILRKYKWMCG